ncbi:DUF2911 domain-containing protein [Hymenobacter sp. PAMC 26628]|uniref:DUF2911 domain-containing protein n=1 Tax=Hymenobacter sp. PAMC 26628 TaxID=1484118 RepID=UPI0007704371|nr:DUF2911 domain-containing protein [Hymenobacter sp. PAMC 26628]AMJ65594.1 hypothetical protein AXW84_09235 [Hymenobacter sp. PAMC 26628]
MQTRFFAPTLGALLFVVAAAQAQDAKPPEDKSKRPSPPATATAVVNGTTVTIDYSRPSLKGRKAFGELEPYGKVWRTGANEATTFTVDKPVKIEGKTLPAGKYGLFTIPTATTWTVIFNKVPNQWGAFKYKDADDALRVTVPAKKLAAPVEVFDITVDKAGKVAMKWDTTEVDFTVK